MSTIRRHAVTLIPGDGVGPEVALATKRVLDAAARRFGFDLKLDHYDWSCETYKKTGKMMPDEIGRAHV